jgi:Uma2 family endonuclease
MLNKTMTDLSFNYGDCLLFPRNKRCDIFTNRNFCMIPAPDIKHQRVSVRLAAALLQRLDNFGTVLEAPCDVRLSHEDIVQPDILFIRKERNGIIGKLSIQGSPDLIIDIISQTARRKNLEAKRRLYSRFGVQECWLVDPEEETIEVLVWCEIGYVQAAVYKTTGQLVSPSLPGIKLQLSEIFKT